MIQKLIEILARVFNIAIHKAAGQVFFPVGTTNTSPPPAPFMAYGNCTRQNHGTDGSREAVGFVNSAAVLDPVE